MTAPQGQRLWIAGMVAILLFAAWVRVTQWPQVFVGDAVLPADGDASYHLHRIERSLESFPHIPVRDAQLSWPDGGPCPWAPGLDFLGAALVQLGGAADDPAQAARIASLLPLLLGLLLTACAMLVARRLVQAPQRAQRAGGERSRTSPQRAGGERSLADPLRGAAVGWASGIALALIPQSVAIGRIARVDHHVAESLSMLLLAGWVLAAVARPRDARGIGFEIAGAACAVFAGAMFSGSPLYVAIAALLLGATHLLQSGDGARWQARIAGSGGPALLAAAPLLAWVNMGAVAEHGQLATYRFPSLLQPALYALAGLAVLGACLVQPVAQTRASPVRRALERVAALSALAAVALAGVHVCAPWLLREVWTGCAEWLGARDPWLSSISEFQPLSLRLVYKQFGILGLLAPVALPLGMWRLWREDPARGAFFAAWTLLLLPLALLQARFGRIFVVNLSIAWGLAAFALVELAAARWRASPRPAAAAPLAACALLLLCLLDPASREHLGVAEARAPSPVEAAGQFLRRTSAERRDGGEGILADWELGNDLLWIAKRPVVASGFGHFTGAEAFQEVMDFPRMSETQLLELMTRRELGYLVTGSSTYLRRVPGPQGSAPFVPRADGAGVLNTPYFQALPLSPLMLAGTALPQIGVKHLEFLRPRFASPQRVGNLALPVPVLWVYERVRGAVVQGTAAPGAQVTAVIRLHTRDFELPYTAWTSADAQGRYQLVIPLPSGLTDDVLRTDPHYMLRVGDQAPRPLEVTERAVVDGQLVALSPLPSAERPLAQAVGKSGR